MQGFNPFPYCFIFYWDDQQLQQIICGNKYHDITALKTTFGDVGSHIQENRIKILPSIL